MSAQSIPPPDLPIYVSPFTLSSMSNTSQSNSSNLPSSLSFPQTTSYTLGEGPPVFEICTCLSESDATAVHTLTITLPENSPLHDEPISIQPDELMDGELGGASIADLLNDVQYWVKFGFTINQSVEHPLDQISFSWVRLADPETTISARLKKWEDGPDRESKFQYYHRLLMENEEFKKSCNLGLKDLRGDGPPESGYEALRALAFTAFFARTIIAGPFGVRL